MTQENDDLGALLTRTFVAHEHLADPDRAVAIAARRSDTRRDVGRLALGAVAAVTLVAVGTSYVVARGSGTSSPQASPGTPHPSTTSGKPPLPPLRTNAENRSDAARAAEQVAASFPAYPGAQETDAAGAPGLKGWTVTISGPSAYTETRERWWTVTGSTAKAVARWYDRHAPDGFRSGGVGGEGDGRTWVTTVDFYQPAAGQAFTTGLIAEVQTLETARGVEVRAVVEAVWPPARPAASFVQDVRSIDVSVGKVRLDARPRERRSSFTVTAPGRVLRVARAFDALDGYPPFIHSCPFIGTYTRYRIVFHVPTGDVTARYDSSNCTTGMSVRRDGAVVGPALAGAPRVIRALGLRP